MLSLFILIEIFSIYMTNLLQNLITLGLIPRSSAIRPTVVKKVLLSTHSRVRPKLTYFHPASEKTSYFVYTLRCPFKGF